MKFMFCNSLKKTFLKRSFYFKFSKLNCKSWSIVFFGSDSYSLLSLEALNNEMKGKHISHLEVVVVNKQSPVYHYSISNNLNIHFWPPNLNRTYDFGVIVSFGKFIPKTIIDHFSLGIFNVHASLLPKYRGGMPIVHAVKNGETTTGVTVTKISEHKFDVGEIILQKSCAIGKNELMPSLYNKLTYLGRECLLEFISAMPKCLDRSFPQSNEGSSNAPKLNKEDAVVKWNEMTALEVFNLHRALFGTFELSSTFRGQPVKFVCLSLKTSSSNFSENGEDNKLKPGCFTYNKLTKFLYVQCKDKTVTVCTLKYNKKMHKSSSFQTGYLQSLSKNFWKFES